MYMKGVFTLANNKVEITGVNTSLLPVLSNEEQLELFKSLRLGDLNAKDKLVEGNLKLVLINFWFY